MIKAFGTKRAVLVFFIRVTEKAGIEIWNRTIQSTPAQTWHRAIQIYTWSSGLQEEEWSWELWGHHWAVQSGVSKSTGRAWDVLDMVTEHSIYPDVHAAELKAARRPSVYGICSGLGFGVEHMWVGKTCWTEVLNLNLVPLLFTWPAQPDTPSTQSFSLQFYKYWQSFLIFRRFFLN